MVISQQLIITSGKNISRPAYRYLGREVTYKDLFASISKLSYLYQHEIGQGARVAIMSRNCPSMIVTLFAMSNIRSVCIPVNPDAPPDEITRWLRETKATHIAISSDLVTKTREIMQSGRMSLPIIEMEKKHGGEYYTKFTPPPEHSPLETDIVLVLRSAGTTGKPKYVNFTHKQLVQATIAPRSLSHLSSGIDRVHTTLSWTHPFAFLHGMFFPLMNGTTFVIDHGLESLEYLEFLVESRVTRLVGVPSYFLKLLLTCKNEKQVLQGIKSIHVGIGSLSPELKKTFDLLKIEVSHVYGQVENLWSICMQDALKPGELLEGFVKGFVGKPLPSIKYKLLTLKGDDMETKGKHRRTGLLAISAHTVMAGYIDREKDTRAAIRGNWLYTGDVVRIEGDSDHTTFSFIGRKEDVIQVNDQLIIPSQIDSVLKSNPFVQDGTAFVTKNSKNNLIIACAIVKKAGVPLSDKQVLDFCRTALPEQLVPKSVVFTDFIPRDIGNNVNCSRLRAQFTGLTEWT